MLQCIWWVFFWPWMHFLYTCYDLILEWNMTWTCFCEIHSITVMRELSLGLLMTKTNFRNEHQWKFNVFSMCGSKIYRLYPFESQKSLHGNWHLQPSVQKQSQSNSDLNLQLIHIKLVWSHLYLKVQSVYAPLMFRVNDGPYFFL